MLLFFIFVVLLPTQCTSFRLHPSFKRDSQLTMINLKNLFDRSSPKTDAVEKSSVADRELIKNNILRECNEHKLKLKPNYKNHVIKIEQLASMVKDIYAESFLMPRKQYSLYHISSVEDENEDENKNINDKFWKLCVKYGDGIMTYTNEFDFPSSSFQVSIVFGGFFEVRYIYRMSEFVQGQGQAVNVFPINFVDFQWYLFGFKMYNRLINRKELWKLQFRDDDTTVFYITNALGEDKQYDRLVVFRND